MYDWNTTHLIVIKYLLITIKLINRIFNADGSMYVFCFNNRASIS